MWGNIERINRVSTRPSLMDFPVEWSDLIGLRDPLFELLNFRAVKAQDSRIIPSHDHFGACPAPPAYVGAVVKDYHIHSVARCCRSLLDTLLEAPLLCGGGKVFENPSSPSSYLLTYLDTHPPCAKVAIGTSTTIPPMPGSFTENRNFMKILNEVVSEFGHQDEDVANQARAFASPGGFNLGSGGAFFRNQRQNRGSSRKQGAGGGSGGSGAGGASGQGGAGGAGKGGWVHLSDRRNPPDFGRIAWPEDILGSVEVNGEGEIVGQVQPSGTYRVVTNEGILGLNPFLREKLIERLKKEESQS
ncbi:hypothetical protein E4U55_006146 [Claviceps digitariae]|nr:hypothetical protein E4U55_006146 [Claviceps digitariae]